MPDSTFPTTLDSWDSPLATDKQNAPSHSLQHRKANEALAALEAKVGVDGSAVATSHDYLLTQRLPLSGGTLTGALGITGGAVVASTPLLNVTQTWNNAAVTFTGWKLNVTNTASAVASRLVDFQVGGSSVLSIARSAGELAAPALCLGGDVLTGWYRNAANQWSWVTGGNTPNLSLISGIVRMQSTTAFGWSSGNSETAQDLILLRDAANILAQRNGTTAQEQRVYNTYTDGSNYERGFLRWTSNEFRVGAEGAGTGANRTVRLTSGNHLYLQGGSSHQIIFNIAGSERWAFNSSGHLICSTDNAYDIGASGATRPRNIYVGTGVTTPLITVASGYWDSSALVNNQTTSIGWSGRGRMYSPADSVIRLANNAGTDFDRLQFGGTTSSFPAIKRSTTELQVRLADDSAYANFAANQGTFNGGVVSTSYLQAASSSSIRWDTRAKITSPADSVVTLTNNASSDFARLQFGGTTSSFPSLKRSSAELHCRLADDSANANFVAANVTASGGVTATSDIEAGGDFNVMNTATAPTAGGTPGSGAYGGSSNVLGDPVGWLRIKVGGAQVAVPYYTPGA